MRKLGSSPETEKAYQAIINVMDDGKNHPTEELVESIKDIIPKERLKKWTLRSFTVSFLRKYYHEEDDGWKQRGEYGQPFNLGDLICRDVGDAEVVRFTIDKTTYNRLVEKSNEADIKLIDYLARIVKEKVNED